MYICVLKLVQVYRVLEHLRAIERFKSSVCKEKMIYLQRLTVESKDKYEMIKRNVFLLLLINLFLLSFLNSSYTPILLTLPTSSNQKIQVIDYGGDSSENPPESITMINLVIGRNRVPIFHPMRDIHNILSLPFDTLVEVNPTTGEVHPSLARQWFVTSDSMHYTFYLHENIYCHDGSILNASAVERTFNAILNENNSRFHREGGLQEFYTTPLDSVEILSEYSIRINFFEPFSPFIMSIASRIRIESLLGPANTSTVEEVDYDWPMGSGPYVFQGVTAEEEFYNYSFTRFENYFRGLPPFKNLQYHLYFDRESAVEAIIAEKGDTAPYLSSVMNSSELNENYWQYYPLPRGLDYALLNHNRVELSNEKVRLALNYAIDKEEHQKYFSTDKYRKFYYTHDFILDNSLPSNFSRPLYPYDLSYANQLLDEAGYPEGMDGYRFSLEITGLPWMESHILFLRPYLDAIGINCTYKPLTPTNWWEVYYAGTYDIYIAGYSFEWDWIYSAYLMFHSDGTENTCGISDPDLDYYIALAYRTPLGIGQERQSYLNRIKQILINYAPHILLNEFDYGCLKTKEVSSYVWFDPIPYWGIYFNYTSFTETFQPLVERAIIDRESVFFPSTDGLITTEDTLTVSIELSHELQTFLHESTETGKFYKILVSNQTSKYRLRCFYDSDELQGFLPDELHLNKWDSNSQVWKNTQMVERNILFQYIEIELRGDSIIRLGEKIEEFLHVITYRFLPGITIAVGVLVTIAAVSILANRKFTRYFKEEYRLK